MEELSLLDDFPPVPLEEWRRLVERDPQVAGAWNRPAARIDEGIEIAPLYTRADWPADGDPSGFAGLEPYTRGSRAIGNVLEGWDIRQEFRCPDPEAANAEIVADLRGGVRSLIIRLDRAARAGLDPGDPDADRTAGRDGVMIYSPADLARVLAGVSPGATAIALDAGAAFLPAAAFLAACWLRSGVEPAAVRGAFNADPLGTLAAEGGLPVSSATALVQMADLAVWTAGTFPSVTAIGVSTAPYHAAGSSAVQDLAFSIATGLEYLRVCEKAGLAPPAAARQILFDYPVDCRFFLATAKLRAARRLWARVVEACGGDGAAQAMRMHARTGRRVLTRRDPWVNMLRNTVCCFAAASAGAESITTEPFDAAVGPPDAFGRRIARNTQVILQEESHLGRVVDPAGGSWMVERLTEQLAEEAWALFQRVEAEGGMAAAVENGWVAERIGEAYTSLARDLSHRASPLTGVSEFPNLYEEAIERPDPDYAALLAAARARHAGEADDASVEEALRALGASVRDGARTAGALTAAAVSAAERGAGIGAMTAVLAAGSRPVERPPLVPHSLAEPFEELRDASDRYLAEHGHRPRVFLANLGAVAEHIERATWAKNLFEAGGLETPMSRGFEDPDAAVAAFSGSGASIAAICSSDEIYARMLAETASKMKGVGARIVVAAAAPAANEDAWRDAGVDRFIFPGCDVVQVLRGLLAAEGAIG